MKYGVVTCHEPKDPNAFYMRNMYHEFFWGPFNSEQEIVEAIAKLDSVAPYWDYEPFCMIHGADPLPKDFVFGFPFVPEDVHDRILKAARPNGKTLL